MPPPVLRIRLLGDLDLRLGDESLPRLESARAESLLGYLLVHRAAPQPRQGIAFLLWPDSTEAQARTNLRHVLHNLRRALPGADRLLEITPRTLWWRPDVPCLLDLASFEQALDDGRLEAAVEAYGGDLLAGAYDDWLLEERERLRARYLDALERLTREAEARGDAVAAIGHAERLVRDDPLREDAHRRLMRLHDAAGDRARALRAYHVCAATLQRELGIDPSPATRAAYEALLEAGPPARPGGRSAAAPPAGASLVGREAEQDRLTALWRASDRGRAQLVLVTGEPGIGKSRLVEELRSWCAQHGALTAEARSYRAEGAVAYGPVVAWLRSEAIAPRLRRLDPVHLTELARLVPDLLAERPDLTRPEPLPEGEQRQRLFEALARAIAVPRAPLLLVAEDLQWCDRPTLQFLHYLLRVEGGARLLIAATARREEVDDDHPLSDLVTGLQELDRCAEIPLARLSAEETGRLAALIAGRELTGADVRRLRDDSEGNPLFVVEALRAGPSGSPAADGALGAKVRAVISARLARLSAPAREVVGVAATIGREFTSPLLAGASGLGEPALVGGLDELWRRGLVRAHGPDAYDFSHGRIRDVAYEALSPAQRRHHHLRVARTLEAAHADDPDAVSGLLAVHYDRAGAPGEAVTWSLRAAEAAQRLHANAEAVGRLERALELTRALPGGPGRDARELAVLGALPAALVGVEGYGSDRVVELQGRARALAERLGVEPEAPLVRSLALASLTRGDFVAARAYAEELRARGERDGDDVLWVESGYVLGVAAYWEGDLRSARSELEGALARYRPERAAQHVLRYGQDPAPVCLMRLAHTLWLMGDDEGAARRRDAAHAAVMQRGHPYSAALASIWTALIAVEDRDEAGLEEQLGALRAVAGREGAGHLRHAHEAFAGLLDVLRGRGDPGIDRVSGAVEDAMRGEPGAPGEAGLLMRVLLEACAVAGDAQAGLAAAEQALSMGRGAQLWEAEARRLRGAFLAALGAPRSEVQAELQRALAVAERQDARALAARARLSLARLGAERPGERPRNGEATKIASDPWKRSPSRAEERTT